MAESIASVKGFVSAEDFSAGAGTGVNVEAGAGARARASASVQQEQEQEQENQQEQEQEQEQEQQPPPEKTAPFLILASSTRPGAYLCIECRANLFYVQ